MKINFRPKIRIPKVKVPQRLKPEKGWSRKYTLFFGNIFGNKKLRRVLVVAVVSTTSILFLVEIVFAVLIYAAKVNNPATKMVAKLVPYPAVLVNFSSISIDDFNFEKAYITHFYDQARKEIPAGMDSQIVDQLIESRLLEQKASAYNVKISNQEVDDTINTLADQNGGRAEVEKVLESYYGLDLKQFRSLVRSQLLRVKMKDTVPVRVKASHILIKVDKAADAATVAAAKAKADGIYNDLKGGADFAEKAKALSDDTGSRDQGGDLGFFSYGDMVKEFQDAAFSLQLNEISQPVRTDYGWHIIKVTDKKGFEKMSFDSWLSGLKTKSFVKNLLTLN